MRLSVLGDRLRDRLLTALTILLVFMLFAIAPLQSAGGARFHFFGIPFGLLLVVTTYVVSRSLVALAPLLVATGFILTATVLRYQQASILDAYLDATGWLIAALSLGVVVARAVYAPGQVTPHRIVGAVLLYLTIGVVFVALFCFVALLEPHAFSGLAPLKGDLSVSSELVYFIFVTLTSVGYGDIVPVHPIARSLANIEAIIGQLYPATLLARLVTLELEGRRSK